MASSPTAVLQNAAQMLGMSLTEYCHEVLWTASHADLAAGKRSYLPPHDVRKDWAREGAEAAEDC
jgi:hypothetical protein